MKTKYLRLLSLLMACLLILCCTACASKESSDENNTAEEQETVEPEPQPEPEPEPDPNIYQNPLNGSMGPVDVSNNRAVAVMINNHKAAQPQCGTQKADIIYEVIAEGGITRMLAVYSSLEDVDVIGSIRSSRPYYIDLALGHDAIYVHAGGSEDAYTMLSSLKLDHMDGVNGGKDALIFYRDADRKAAGYAYEHTLMTTGQNILDYIESSGMRTTNKSGYTPALSFGETASTAEGKTADIVTVDFSKYKTGVFVYNTNTLRYNVFQYDEAQVDGDTGEQLNVKNLLVLETTSKIIDDYGRNSFTTTGSGTGTYYCEGKSIDITWERSKNTDPLVYKTTDGSLLQLMPGNTYICIINPKNSTVTAE